MSKIAPALALLTGLLAGASAFSTAGPRRPIAHHRHRHHHHHHYQRRRRRRRHSSSALAPLGAESKSGGELWRVQRIARVSDWSPSPIQTYPNPLSLKEHVPSSWFVGENDAVAVKVQVDALETIDESCLLPDDSFEGDDDEDEVECEPQRLAFVLAGPRREIAFDPGKCRAAIVTCGGLCPGLNTVVREVVMCLRKQYGVNETYGVKAGYRGFLAPETWVELDEDVVKNWHERGGSMLGSSRGGHDTSAIVDALVERGINLLFVVGGDGTIRGASRIAGEVEARGLPVSVAVVPKTIDNDVPIIDRTFGFETAVEAARRAIDVANVEAEGFPSALGVVKVMGRNSGFIAMHAALGCGVADLCLVPEVDFHFDGPGGIADHLYERIARNGKAVVVVAEGAGQALMAGTGAAGEERKDASGNVLLDDVGPWLCRQLKLRLDGRVAAVTEHGDELTTKYVDPSYMIRAVPPTTADNLYCLQLAHNAVHGAMAGYGGFVVGSINTRECYVPMEVVANRRNVIDTSHQSLWEYVVFATGQPAFQKDLDPENDDDAITTASGGVVLSTE